MIGAEDPQVTRRLADGNVIPCLGLGVWQVDPGETTEEAVSHALAVGYRHVDTAQIYRNEEGVGRAIKASGLPRQEIFVTTKFDPRRRHAEKEAERSLERLGVDYVDLYLVHWPQGGPTWAWPEMERARERGLARSIGVSNFDADELAAVLAAADAPPVVNQVEFNPFAFRRQLQEQSEREGVAIEAYSPLTTGRNLGDPVLAEVAARVKRTPAQVLLRWALQHDTIVLPKSVGPERIEENAAIFDFKLNDAEMSVLDALDRTGGTSIAREGKWW
ncbi:MAG: aldo/keto reductase [Actinomycetota bacterium]|nr:aldo/keto reductase [Actinomycetota bacterium]